MNVQKLIAFFLVLPFPISLTLRPANAFNLVYTKFPTSFDYQPAATYKTTVGNDGLVTRDFLRKIPPPNTKSKYWRVLTSSFPTGWDFRRSGVPVYGDFLINKYRVCPPGSSCAALGGSVGSELDLVYRPNFTLAPNTRQPDPNTGRVRWIQWVRSNHSLATGYHGDKESVIDVDNERPGNGSPFYYAGSDLANRDSIYAFIDAPKRGDIGWDHDWLADLYLSEEITKPGSNTRKVLIYGGVRWGWKNRVNRRQPEPNPNPVCIATISASSGGGGCPTTTASRTANPELSSLNTNNTYQSSTSIPESTSTFGLLALTTWSVISAIKIKKDKQQ